MQALSKLRSWMGSIRSKTMIFVLGTSFAVVLLLVSCFFLWYRRAAIRDYHNLVELRLSDTDVVLSKYLEIGENLAYGWFASPGGTLCRVSPDFRIVSNMNFLNRIRNDLSYNSYIQSVYFINSHSEISLWVKGEGVFTEDLGLLLPEKTDEISKTGQPFIWTVNNLYGDKSSVKLLSIAISEAPIGSPHYTGTVVINIDLEALSKSILSDTGPSADQLYIIDENGVVAVHNDVAHLGEDWSQRPPIAEIITSLEHGFRVVSGEDGQEIATIQSTQKGYAVVAESNYVVDSLGINSFINSLLVVLVGISLLLIWATFWVSRRLYRPLDSVITNLRESTIIPVDNNDSDEAKFLHQYFKQVYEQVMSLRQKEEHDFVVKNLAMGSRGRDIQPLLLKSGVLRKDCGYYAVSALFLSGDVAPGMETIDAVRAAIGRIYTDELSKVGQCTCYELGLRHLFFVVCEPTGIKLERDVLLAACDLAHMAVSGVFPVRLFFVASERQPNEQTPCREVYTVLEGYLRVATIYGEAYMDSTSTLGEKPDANTINEMLDALKQRNRKAYTAAIHQMAAEARGASYRQFITWTVDVTDRIIRLWEDMGREKANLGTDTTRRQLESIDTLETLYDWFDALYDDVSEKIHKVSRSTAVGAIEEAVEYIRNHYDDSALGAVMLADRFHISASYFSRLFREFTGCSVPDYIVRLRMEKAHDLLLSGTNLDIAQIAEKVGYTNNSYFAASFRKYYGVAPSKLRTSLRTDE